MVSILAPSAAKNAAASEPCELPGAPPSADAPQVAATPLQPGADAPAGRAQPPGADLRDALGARWARFVAAAACELEALPNSAFAAAPPPPHPGYSPPQRVAAAAWTALLYGALGLACGGAGQARTHTHPRATRARVTAPLCVITRHLFSLSLPPAGADERVDARCARGRPRHAARSGAGGASVGAVHGDQRMCVPGADVADDVACVRDALRCMRKRALITD